MADDLELWRGDGDRDGARFDVIGVADTAMVGANDAASLRAILRQRERYPAIKRKATNTYTVEAMGRTPLAVVYRSDMVRDQLRRLIADDRGALELTRWATSMGSIRAWRDGWIGLAPPVDRTRTAVRLVGATDWVKDLSTQGEPAPVPLATLGSVGADARLAVALHDPGLYAEDLLRAGPGNGATFATEEDPKDSGGVDLFDVVDRYDGDAALGLYRDRIELHAAAGDGRDALLEDTEAAIRIAGVRRLAVASSGATGIELTWSFAAGGAAAPHPTLQDGVDLAPTFARAGAPPRPPVAWIWANPSASTSDAIVGWITWDRTERLTYAFDVPLGQLAATARLVD
ncbi:MAG: hypothetical protein JWM90_2566 [Thermoleophilia bacterium]|nr:hypothetical protein [Thermoleophilia bacterium]